MGIDVNRYHKGTYDVNAMPSAEACRHRLHVVYIVTVHGFKTAEALL